MYYVRICSTGVDEGHEAASPGPTSAFMESTGTLWNHYDIVIFKLAVSCKGVQLGRLQQHSTYSCKLTAGLWCYKALGVGFWTWGHGR